ncbi:hypothetical protein RHIZO_00489 [Rhizobiaceae bacterium]|nr:hypothetical protein RHIZO_00489 [Rhizobiaceae bacterium]
MATAAQFAGVLSRALGLSEGRIGWCATSLRTAGYLRSSQGVPIDLANSELALVLIAALLGTPAGSTAGRVMQYARLVSDGGCTLADSIAGLLDRPADLVRLTIDITQPAAVLIIEGDGETHVGHFGPPEADFSRCSILSGDNLSKIQRMVRALPLKRAGRPQNRARYAV